ASPGNPTAGLQRHKLCGPGAVERLDIQLSDRIKKPPSLVRRGHLYVTSASAADNFTQQAVGTLAAVLCPPKKTETTPLPVQSCKLTPTVTCR
ncbi:MAG: hypothetical protein AAF827_00625, partial [Cyanobacteria bacterium P01_D01_bin.6]